MLHVALWEPEIPPNTGNVARLCAATGTRLHLIGRLGFRIDDKTLKRAGLDYWPHVDLARHENWEAFEGSLISLAPSERGTSIWLIDNPAPTTYTRAAFRNGDVLVFGSETKGLPSALRERYANRLLGIPMPTGNVRSLNLSTATGIVLYEALRQIEGW
jgi:tRNA (cytidine/uridine-2'-O-)-methyltransferase